MNTVELTIKSELYGKTVCVVNEERFKEGKRIFPCGDGSDHKLTESEIRRVAQCLKLNS